MAAHAVAHSVACVPAHRSTTTIRVGRLAAVPIGAILTIDHVRAVPPAQRPATRAIDIRRRLRVDALAPPRERVPA